jgi:hypothetical protein
MLVSKEGHAELIGKRNRGVAPVGRRRHPDVAVREDEHKVAQITTMGAHWQSDRVGAPNARTPRDSSAVMGENTHVPRRGTRLVARRDQIEQFGELGQRNGD